MNLITLAHLSYFPTKREREGEGGRQSERVRGGEGERGRGRQEERGERDCVTTVCLMTPVIGDDN